MLPGESEANQKLLQTVYDHFRDNGTWPTYRSLEILFRKAGPLYEIVASMDRQLMRVEDIYREDAVCYLTLEGLSECEGASKDIQNIIDIAALFAMRYIQNSGTAQVTSDEIEIELELTEPEVRRACEMYWRFGWNLTGGGGRTNGGKSFNFVVGRNAFMFEGVKTLDDFRERVKKIDEKEEQERRLNQPFFAQQSVADLLKSGNSINAEEKMGNLHDKVREVSLSLFNSEHYDESARAALQHFEAVVQELVGRPKDAGQALMSIAFREQNPLLRISPMQSLTDVDEQQGMMFLSMGAMTGIRNPLSHGPKKNLSPEEAMEILSFVSYLFRKIDQRYSAT